ncbi:protein FAR1-RELATED SEQUENCE 9-like [Hordeum vulgare]|nr:protein FAR1-RELATED SEQUENCE 9-like [Hordeum vulgare]
MKKAQEELGRLLADDQPLNKAFKDCCDNSLTVEEFEEKWWKMLDEHGQTDNEHFHWLWENRECWVPVYYMHNFFPFPQTTARSEGFNSMMKKYVNPNKSLVEFAKQYTGIQAKVLVSVAKEQVETIYKEMDMYSFNPLELQVRGLYTQNIYSKFQMEMKEHIHALAASSSEMGYYAHMCYE